MFLNCPSVYVPEGVQCPTTEEVSTFKTAVAHGWITWHAFPFNGEAEATDVSLYEYALQMTHSLDDLFAIPHKVLKKTFQAD
jgi:hypothetical protein